jgi:hypothetical protein
MKIANLERDCLVCIDACKEGIGGVLMQYNHVVCKFMSHKKIKEHERDYASHDLELVVAHALKM